jgi:membrane-associated PAP2 superfamily phosphatase
MSRRGLIVALVFAAAIGLVFGLFPSLDIEIANLFYDPAAKDFPLRTNSVLRYLREAASWILVLLIAPSVLALLIKLVIPRAKPWISSRAAIFLIATLALAPGFVVNVLLKNHWDRPRPVAVVEFGGSERFVPWWDPRGQCVKNCSFVSGETSSAFWTLAPATLVPAPWRFLGYTAAIGFGVGMGVVRMAMGAHFFTDVVFAGLFTFIIIVLIHGLIFRSQAADAESSKTPLSTPAS